MVVHHHSTIIDAAVSRIFPGGTFRWTGQEAGDCRGACAGFATSIPVRFWRRRRWAGCSAGDATGPPPKTFLVGFIGPSTKGERRVAGSGNRRMRPSGGYPPYAAGTGGLPGRCYPRKIRRNTYRLFCLHICTRCRLRQNSDLADAWQPHRGRLAGGHCVFAGRFLPRPARGSVISESVADVISTERFAPSTAFRAGSERSRMGRSPHGELWPRIRQ